MVTAAALGASLDKSADNWSGALNTTSLRTLEFETVRALLLSHAGSADGKARLRALAPQMDAARVRRAIETTTEGVRILRAPGRQPYHDLPDLTEILPAARVQGLHLEPSALIDVASFVEGAVEIAVRLARAEGAPRLSALAARVRDTSAVAAAIRRALLPSGEVADHASPRLAEARRAIVRLRVQLQSVMESFLRGKEADRLLQDKLVTTRNDRYVLILKAENRGQVPGIIHGSSGSGASLFVEPLPAVELNNDIVSLQDEERREVVRILKELTGRVAERADDLAETVSVLGELDAVQAMALAARDMDAVAPRIADDLRLELLDARHPFLMQALAERLGIERRPAREPVPVTIRIDPKRPVLVISGPNTGGKTVALKTVGLLALMAQCGLHVPAAEGSVLPAFRSLYADIGDDQSIAANLSTFSAHLKAIVDMTRGLELPALVLLDEVGAGTDPTEGGALGVAIVEHFRQRGAMTLATTHHGLMKGYAQSTEGVACASFGYDPANYEPTYRLALGAPGRSLALEMAERLGLPPAVVSDARTRLDQKQAQAEALLKRLEEGEASLGKEQARLREERRELDAARERHKDEERALHERKRREVEAFARELRRRGEEAARRAADAIQEAVKRVERAPRSVPAEAARARTAALAEIRAAQEDVLADPALGLRAEMEAPGAPLAVGGRVKVASLGISGEIVAFHGESEAELAVAGKRLRVPKSDLIGVTGGRARSGASTGHSFTAARPSAGGEGEAEINLVGLTVDEAIPRVDKALDEAAVADRQQLRVIHGFGEGRLRRAVAGLLEGHPHVAAFRAGAAGEGGGGVTIVELKG